MRVPLAFYASTKARASRLASPGAAPLRVAIHCRDALAAAGALAVAPVPRTPLLVKPAAQSHSVLPPRRASAAKKKAPGAGGSIKVTFVKPDGARQTVEAPIGD